MDEEITTNRVVRKIQQLPQHNTIKLNETIYLLWKQRVMLILEGYGVQEYIQDSATISQFIVNEESQLIENPEFFFHNQQDKLLASWLLPTKYVQQDRRSSLVHAKFQQSYHLQAGSSSLYCYSSVSTKPLDQAWYLDSGVTNYVTNDLSNLEGAYAYTGFIVRGSFTNGPHS
ncbi:uncharacterized protein [Gossypium hirsutum]|uniref:Uncharacterized protein n=1 Tax=Gossypium hirsutum TaxID=3635 RepID=A0ABM3C394_GOSHI|nr:uncharacterized protein LOC121232236 [Gossypium hirsutum]